MGDRIYRIWCDDGPRHDAVPGSRLPALVSSGHLDIEDKVAPAGTEDWSEGWEIDGLFEATVVHALHQHRATMMRMRRSIKGGWMSVVEYREQRDRLLLAEPGVADSLWAARPRPDLKRAGAQSELQRAASEGADAERQAEQSRRRGSGGSTTARTRAPETPAKASMVSFRRNVGRILHGDLPAWADPTTALQAWRDHGVRYAITTLLLALAADPLEPVLHTQRWLVAALGTAAIASILMQLASNDRDRTWATRFAACLMGLVVAAITMIVCMQIDVERGAFGHWLPPVERLQASLRSALGRG